MAMDHACVILTNSMDGRLIGRRQGLPPCRAGDSSRQSGREYCDKGNRYQSNLKMAMWNCGGLTTTCRAMCEEKDYDVLTLTVTHCTNTLVISDRMAGSLTYSGSVSSQILLARFRGRYTNLTVIVVYMPTSVRSNPSQEDTYRDLYQLLNQISKHNAVILMGDFNAKLAQGPDAHVLMYPHSCQCRMTMTEESTRGL